MSIKGGSQELFVGKKESNIISFLGRKTTITYSDLDKIEYCYFKLGSGGGYLRFKYPNGKMIEFGFNHKANEKIERTISLIAENNPELEIIEHSTDSYKFYQKDWFIILMLFICCMPIGLFLMWYYKKYDKPVRIMMTIFFITIYGIGIFAMMPHTYDYHITLEEYNQCQPGMSYEECVNIIGGYGEQLSAVNIVGIQSAVYIWYGDSSGISNANMTFTNNELVSKAQIGLK